MGLLIGVCDSFASDRQWYHHSPRYDKYMNDVTTSSLRVLRDVHGALQRLAAHGRDQRLYRVRNASVVGTGRPNQTTNHEQINPTPPPSFTQLYSTYRDGPREEAGVRKAQAAVHGVGGELQRLLPHVQLLALGRVALRLLWFGWKRVMSHGWVA